MKDDYTRLLIAAKDLKNWETPAEIARQLTLHGYKTTEQVMTNWKSRGISAKARLACAHIIGYRPHWLETGSGEMSESKPRHANTQDKSATVLLTRERHPIYFKLDDCSAEQLDKILALIHAAEAVSKMDRSAGGAPSNTTDKSWTRISPPGQDKNSSKEVEK